MAADALPRSSPSAQDVDATGVAAFVDALEADPGVEPHSLMLLRHGRVVAEGWWAPYAADRPHLLYSLSKSFVSAALGMAVEEALVGLDDTVLGWFPELDGDIRDGRSRRMRLRDVAAMASGHASETLERAYRADPLNLVRGFLLTPPDREPGSVFAYNQPCTYAVAAVIARASGGSLLDFLRPRLLDPLGIGDVGWLRDPGGLELGFSGLHATTDAVARLGQLHLQRGAWNGAQILPRWWVEQATCHQIDTPSEPNRDWRQGYGYQFWRSQHGYRGDGAYGQLCVVLPEHDAVLAMTAATSTMQAVLDAAWRHLVPALDGAHARAVDDHALADRLAGLTLPLVEASGSPSGAWEGYGSGVVGGPVSGVAVGRAGDAWHVTLTDRATGAGFPVPVGQHGWTVTTADGAPVGVSGGWTDADTLRFDVVFLETPHRLEVTCPRTGRPTVRWQTEPLHPLPLQEMRSPGR